MTTKITEQNILNLANVGVNWQSVITADGSTVTSLDAGKGYFIDTTSAVGLVSLPTSSNVGDTIAIKDYAGTFATNALTIQRNGNNIQGVANNSQIGTNRASIVLVYIDSTKGWLYTNESNVADLQAASFIPYCSIAKVFILMLPNPMICGIFSTIINSAQPMNSLGESSLL